MEEPFVILIVDDIKENIQHLGEQLRANNYKVAAANNGEHVFDIIKKITPDLILLDIMIPGMNGFEICQRLKSIPATKDIPIIFLTAKTDMESINQGFELGAVDYLTKPFNNRELLSRVKTHLKLRTSYRDLYVLNEKLQQMIKESELIADALKDSHKLISSLNEKEVLLKEIHHRVKNNLQIISSLVGMQCDYVTEEKTLHLFRECQNRIKSIALVHEELYQSESLAYVDMSQYIQKLTQKLFFIYNINPEKITFSLNIAPILLEIDKAIPCGLILNEIISNSLKYAFAAKESGNISIRFKKIKQEYNIDFRDNGIGLPENFDIENIKSLGLKLVKIFVEQIEGKLEIQSSKGIHISIIFPS